MLASFDESRGELFDVPGLWYRKHAPPVVVRALLPDRVWQDYFKFVFVRHPLDWFVSQYRHNVGYIGLPIRRILNHPSRTLGLFRQYRTIKRQAKVTLFQPKDVEFLYQRLQLYRAIPTEPTLFQSSYVFDIDGQCLVDFIGRFERFDVDVTTCLTRVGIQVDVPHENATSHRHYRDCFTPEAAQLVYKLWRKDFDAFGYEF